MEYSTSDLELQDAQVLPEREALAFANWLGFSATNSALAVNAATAGSTATATAMQGIFVVQS